MEDDDDDHWTAAFDMLQWAMTVHPAVVTVLADLQRTEYRVQAHLGESEWQFIEELFSFLQVIVAARKLCCAMDTRLPLSCVVLIYNKLMTHLASSIVKYEAQERRLYCLANC